jgi:hypothetical protein
MSDTDNTITEEDLKKYFVDLKKHVPPHIYNDPSTMPVQVVQGRNIGMIRYYIDNLVNNTFISKCDEWGLEIFEKEYNVTPKPTDTLDTRRNRILAKKKGMGTITPYIIRQICNDFVDNAKITQHFEDYYFELFLENVNKGFDNFLEDLIEIIEELKPAHLGTNYILTQSTKSNLYTGSVLLNAEIITIYPWTSNSIELTTNIYIPISNGTSLEIVTIYPQIDNTLLYYKTNDNKFQILNFE